MIALKQISKKKIFRKKNFAEKKMKKGEEQKNNSNSAPPVTHLYSHFTKHSVRIRTKKKMKKYMT